MTRPKQIIFILYMLGILVLYAVAYYHCDALTDLLDPGQLTWLTKHPATVMTLSELACIILISPVVWYLLKSRRQDASRNRIATTDAKSSMIHPPALSP